MSDAVRKDNGPDFSLGVSAAEFPASGLLRDTQVVLLVEGRQKLATAIKYLTQSTWSHAALYAGNLPPMFSEQNAVSSVVLTHGYPLTCRGKQKCNRAV